MAVKKRTEADWTDLRTFAVLARHGTLSAAARVLKVNHATIARRLGSLETTLNVKLMQRRPHGFTLSAEGEEVLKTAAAMESASAGLARLGDPAPHGEVRIAVSPSVCDGFLSAHIAELSRDQPLLDIALVSGLRPLSLAHHETDIAIRLGRPTDSELVGCKLANLALGIFTGAKHAAALRRGQRPNLVTFDEANAHLPEARLLASHFAGNRVSFQASSQWAQARAAADGLGIALLPRFVARQFPSLVRVFPEIALPSRDLWLLCRRGDRRAWPIGPTREFLVELFKRERVVFEG